MLGEIPVARPNSHFCSLNAQVPSSSASDDANKINASAPIPITIAENIFLVVFRLVLGMILHLAFIIAVNQITK